MELMPFAPPPHSHAEVLRGLVVNFKNKLLEYIFEVTFEVIMQRFF